MQTESFYTHYFSEQLHKFLLSNLGQISGLEILNPCKSKYIVNIYGLTPQNVLMVCTNSSYKVFKEHKKSVVSNSISTQSSRILT